MARLTFGTVFFRTPSRWQCGPMAALHYLYYPTAWALGPYLYYRLCAGTWAISLLSPLRRHLGRGRQNNTRFGRQSGQRVFLLSDDVYHKVMRSTFTLPPSPTSAISITAPPSPTPHRPSLHTKAFSLLCEATGGGCAWRKNTARMRPSTGFFAVVMAMQLCRKV